MKATSADRLGVTILFSVIAHAVIALGVSFDYEKMRPRLPSLEVILLQSASGENPDKADFLAQANNSGGGESDEAKRPSQPVSGPLPQLQDGVAPVPMQHSTPRQQQGNQRELQTIAPSDFTVRNQPASADMPDLPQPNDREQLERQLEMARLANELQQDAERYAKRPKRKFISANTREYAYANYMKSWVARVERVGNINYPDEARRQQLRGQLILTVGMSRDGSIKSIDVIKSSGHSLLDEAAQRIVRLAAPFPSIPANEEQLDELYVTRTWQFLPGDTLQTK